MTTATAEIDSAELGTEIGGGVFIRAQTKGAISRGQKKMLNIVDGGEIVNALRGRSCLSATSESSFGDQFTIAEEGTLSVDFQGIRASGTGGLFWCDVQIQAGKSKNRNTYAQVLIQCSMDSDDDGIIAAAIEQGLAASLASQNRVLVLTASGHPHPPK